MMEAIRRHIPEDGIIHSPRRENTLLVDLKEIVSATIQTEYCIVVKIRGFRGGDYEKRRLLGYKNPVRTSRTSQETHYVSATESSQLMLCKI
jgi:hypothetical protein